MTETNAEGQAVAATHGFVYILTNRSMPGLVKVGQTYRNPYIRLDELNATGVPLPFSIYSLIFVDDCVSAEKEVHEYLSSHRLSKNREFFTIPADTAEAALFSVVEHRIFLPLYQCYIKNKQPSLAKLTDDIKILREIIHDREASLRQAKNVEGKALKELSTLKTYHKGMNAVLDQVRLENEQLKTSLDQVRFENEQLKNVVKPFEASSKAAASNEEFYEVRRWKARSVILEELLEKYAMNIAGYDSEKRAQMEWAKNEAEKRWKTKWPSGL